MAQQMPRRVFDVGIAEQHAVTFAAGLAAAGQIPFCNVYSTFLQRAYDSIIHDVALQNLQVVLCLDRAGLVGEDGATHHGAYDLAYLRCVPNIVVAAPMNELELRNMLYTAQLPHGTPFAIRYPRGRGVLVQWRKPFEIVPIGKARQLRQGSHVAVLSLGHAGNFVDAAASHLSLDGITVAHYDMRFAKPIDEDALHEVGRLFERVLTLEDGAIEGGMGSAVCDFFAANGYATQVVRLGIPDRFVEHGAVEQLQAECGFDSNGIERAIKNMVG
jgi:1-deoxy-D-xylulose-5-phosphate synthase